MSVRSYDLLKKIVARFEGLRKLSLLFQSDCFYNCANYVDQYVTLEGIKHAILTSDELFHLVQEVDNSQVKLASNQSLVFTQLKSLCDNARLIPMDLTEAFAQARAECYLAWRHAYNNNESFSSISSCFDKLVCMVQDIATIKSEISNCSKYDTLLLNYDSDFKAEEVDSVFEDVGGFLRFFVPMVIDQQEHSNSSLVPIKGKFPIAKQKKLWDFCLDLFKINTMVNVATHNKCGFEVGEGVCIKKDESQFLSPLASVLYRAARVLYLDQVESSCLMAVSSSVLRECHSSLISRYIGTSYDFLSCLNKKMKTAFNIKGSEFSLNNIYENVLSINNSPVIYEVDEVTYPLHLMCRYTLEKALIEGDIAPRHLPEAWMEEMKHYTGIMPKNDIEGCMQNPQWFFGCFGYIPIYLLGSVMAAGVFQRLIEAVDFKTACSTGNMTPVMGWMNSTFYRHASKLSSKVCYRKVTQLKNFNTSCYEAYLKGKYLND